MSVKSLQSQQKKADSVYYLKLLEKFNIDPNFWCSEEYFRLAKFKLRCCGNVYWIEEPGVKNTTIFPPINRLDGSLYVPLPLKYRIWSDLDMTDNRYPLNRFPLQKKFLDYEYFYDPKDFLKMEGKKWAVFRKNKRKWPRRTLMGKSGNVTYIDFKIVNCGIKYNWIIDLIKSWLSSDLNKFIQDEELLIKYTTKGMNRKILFDINNQMILGMNIWDENYKYINYRYCIVRPMPFLSEYMRYLFYIDPLILNSNKLVNDGGVLDNPNLKKFKDKLNPCYIRSIYSWE